MATVLFRWKFEAVRLTKAEVVNRALIPLLQRGKLSPNVSSYYVSTHDDDPNASRPTVWLVCFGQALKEQFLRREVEQFRAACEVLEFTVAAKDRMLQADCVWYRKRVRQVADIALEWHASQQHQNHRQLLGQIFGQFGETLAGESHIRPYTKQFSPTYNSLNPTTTAEDSFWRECYRPGPSSELSSPVHWLFNIVLF